MAKTSDARAKAQERARQEPAKASERALPEMVPIDDAVPALPATIPLSAMDGLDAAIALMLADLNSRSILKANRASMLLEDTLRLRKDPGYEAVEGLTSDLSRLYEAALTMERDPEVIRRNTLASILMTLSPMLVGVQDLLDTPGFPMWKIGMEGLVLTMEVLGSTQYLEAAKLISASNYERSLWEAERRVGDIIVSRGGSAEDLARDHAMAAEFFDNLRGDRYPHEQRPAIFFFVSLIIVIISYSIIKKKGAK